MRSSVEFAASAIVMLLVTIGPLETAAIFGVLTAGARRRMRSRLAIQAVAIAGGVLGDYPQTARAIATQAGLASDEIVTAAISMR